MGLVRPGLRVGGARRPLRPVPVGPRDPVRRRDGARLAPRDHVSGVAGANALAPAWVQEAGGLRGGCGAGAEGHRGRRDVGGQVGRGVAEGEGCEGC